MKMLIVAFQDRFLRDESGYLRIIMIATSRSVCLALVLHFYRLVIQKISQHVAWKKTACDWWVLRSNA